MFCYFHFVIKTRATCRPKSRCQSDLSTVSVLANRSLHEDLMHSGCHGTAVPDVCLQAFSLFPLPSSPRDQRGVHSLDLLDLDNIPSLYICKSVCVYRRNKMTTKFKITPWLSSVILSSMNIAIITGLDRTTIRGSI